jgi:hypothetical protein
MLAGLNARFYQATTHKAQATRNTTRAGSAANEATRAYTSVLIARTKPPMRLSEVRHTRQAVEPVANDASDGWRVVNVRSSLRVSQRLLRAGPAP